MINAQASNVRSVNVRKMTVIGVLSAISIMLSVLPIGYIPIGPTSATIMHIPVIIGAIVEGPVVGMVIGFIFGMTSLIRAFTAPSIVSFAFMNPIVSVLPRILIGVIAYYCFKTCVKLTKNNFVSGWITGVIGSIANTAGVLGMVYVLYADRYVEAMGQSADMAGKVILGIVLTNGIPEAIVGGFIVSAICVAINKRKK